MTLSKCVYNDCERLFEATQLTQQYFFQLPKTNQSFSQTLVITLYQLEIVEKEVLIMLVKTTHELLKPLNCKVCDRLYIIVFNKFVTKTYKL